ncbi:FMN-binding protein [Candidatus Moduliflexota bacterium]
MREVLKFGLLLGLVCALSAGTLAAVFSKVDPLIKENERLEAIAKRKKVLPQAETFEAVELNGRTAHIGLDEGRNPLGTALAEAPRGYAGPIKMTIGIVGAGDETRLTGVAISKLDQSETPGLGVKITLPSFLDMFKGLSLDEVALSADGGKIDAITAATISSRAVVNGVRDGMTWYARNFPEGPAAPTGEVEDFEDPGAQAPEKGGTE